MMGGYKGSSQNEFMPKARSAARRALELDPNLPEAHTALAVVVQNYDHDWETAGREFQRAIQLNPNYATGHHWYAEHLSFLGRFDEALRESERARELDPLSLIIATDRGAILYYSRQYDEAIAQFRSVMEMDPDFSRTGMILHAYVERGLFDETLALLARRLPADAANWGPWAWANQGYFCARAGQIQRAQIALKNLLALNQRQPVDPETLAWVYVGLNDKEHALDWLEKAYQEHSNVITTLKVEPAFDSLRPDPRFQDLLRRAGLS